jgi:hypothetical protein
MQKIVIFLSGMVVMALLIWGYQEGFQLHHQETLVAAQPTPPHPPPPPIQPTSPLYRPNPNLFKEYRLAREKVLADNHDLAVEYQSVLDAMRAEEAVIDATMSKSDPKMAPIVAKLEAARKQSVPQAAQPSAPVPNNPLPGSNKPVLTKTEWQELSVARQTTLKANTQLMIDMKQLSERAHAFQQKLDAAMLQVDPNIAPIISRIEGHGPGLHTRPLPQSVQTPDR